VQFLLVEADLQVADSCSNEAHASQKIMHVLLFIFCPSPLPFGGSTVLTLTRRPAEPNTTSTPHHEDDCSKVTINQRLGPGIDEELAQQRGSVTLRIPTNCASSLTTEYMPLPFLCSNSLVLHRHPWLSVRRDMHPTSPIAPAQAGTVFSSNARWLSPGRLSSRKDNCIVQID